MEIKRRVENTIDWCKTNKKNVSKTMTDILEICDRELAYLDIQYLKLENLKKGVDKNQTQVDLF